MKNVVNIKNVIIFLIIVMALSMPSSALREPWQYKEGECELVAKEYQKIYGGSLVFVQPLKENGAFDLGPYNGWFLNKVYNKEKGVYYIDYMSQTYFNNTKEILDFYYIVTGKRAEIYDMGKKRPPFNIIWHY